MSTSPNDPSLEAPFLSHLIELKDRLMRSVIVIIAAFIVMAPFATDIYDLLVTPLTSHFPEDQTTLIATKPVGPFLTPYKLVLMLSLYAVMPYLLYQLWGFVAPGLYKHEKKLVMPLLLSSTVLYYVGMAFAFFVVLPLVFGFLSSFGPESMTYSPDIGEYLDFVLAIFLAFGIAFEVPIATILLIATGMVEKETLKAKRPYVVIGAFVIGMFLTPPDVISQTLLAVPMWLLFEAGLFFSGMFVRNSEDRDTESENSIGGSTTSGATAGAAAGAAGVAAAGFAETGVGSAVEETQSSIEDPQYGDSEDYREMSEEEMEAELDAMDDDEEDSDEDPYEDSASATSTDEESTEATDNESKKEGDEEKEEELPWHLQVHEDDYADEP